MTRAAVYVSVGEPLEIREVEVDEPRAGELKLRTAAAGVCHTDLSFQNGTMPVPGPLILGHEGAGIVEAVGPDVTDFAPGDHVCVSYIPVCGECYYCTRGQTVLCEPGTAMARTGGMADGTYRTTQNGAPLPQLCSVGLFADATVITQRAAVKIDPTIDLRSAALIGCGVLTGVGAAMNTASIRADDTVAVIGCGGVGLNVIQGASMAGAGRIIAVDMPGKLELARTFGATDVVDASSVDPVEAVKELTSGRGADVAFEVVGAAPTEAQALAMTRPGGETVLVGMPSLQTVLELPVARGLVRFGNTVKGCSYGSCDFRRDVPRYIDAYRDGRLKLDELISNMITLDEINDAFDALEAGTVARSVIVF